MKTLDSINDFSPKQAAIWFWLVVGSLATLWVILPTLFHWGYRDDALELQFIGKEWVLATRKHPMLPAWILEIINILTNRAFAAPFIAAQLCAVISLWSVWRLGRQVLSEKLALLGIFAVTPYWYFTINSTKFNQNNVLIMFWSLSIYFVFQAFQTRRLRYWIGAGAMLGLVLHAKYTAVFLIFAILVFTVLNTKTRGCWKGIYPYLTIFTAFLVFLPHLIWLYQNDWATLTYAQDRATGNTLNQTFFLFSPLSFLVSQIQYLIPIVAILSPVLFFGNMKKRNLLSLSENEVKKTARQFLFICWAIPLLCHIFIAAIFGSKLQNEYGVSFWLFFGTWLLLCFPINDTAKRFNLSVKFFVVLEIFLIALFFYESLAVPYIDHKPRKNNFPMQELGAACDKIWSDYSLVSCLYVTGDWHLAGSAACMMKNRPSVHFYWQGIESPDAKPTGTWSTDEDVNQKGGMIIWTIPNNCDPNSYVPDWVHKRFPNAEVLAEPIILYYKTRAKVPPLKAKVAIITPRN
ncbi:MAG: glycosyltransferase family 39 protein [Planctomycetaceae bacterium]|jgi:hypothetical protein|nr:glycosyltransferase family 39 protein [Planctomycetaceae bacterium]